MSGHTPGPWKFDRDNYGVTSRAGYSLLNSRGDTLGVTVHKTDVFGQIIAETEANACLIAAAPLMLAELKRIKEMTTAPDVSPEEALTAIYLASLAAIRAAEGGE